MTPRRSRPSLGVPVFFAVTLSLSAYFTFAAVQGERLSDDYLDLDLLDQQARDVLGLVRSDEIVVN